MRKCSRFFRGLFLYTAQVCENLKVDKSKNIKPTFLFVPFENCWLWAYGEKIMRIFWELIAEKPEKSRRENLSCK